MSVASFVAVLAGASGASAQDRPAQITQIDQCRALTDAAARLACYDQAAAALEAATRAGDLVVVDRAEIRETERRRFGFSLPSLPSLPSFSGDTSGVDSVSSTLAQVETFGVSQRLRFFLADGSIWNQTDSASVRRRPDIGAPVTIRRAALGSFMLTVGPSRDIRVERVQ